MVEELEHHPQILIVEDDPSICELMKLVIASEDHWKPTTVDSGELALDAWKNSEFDVILMDLKMMEKDGIETTKEIRELEKSSSRKRTPIIAFTALASENDRKKCIESGFDDFIAKPGTTKNVIDTVYKHLPSS